MTVAFGSVGAASTQATPATVTPAMPAGVAVGDFLICCHSRRAVNTDTFTANNNWTLLRAVTGPPRINIWFKIATGTDSLTLTMSGSPVTNATTITQVARFTNAAFDSLGSNSANTSQQNIGPITGGSLSADGAVIVIGAKQDDWTSVATLTGDSLTWVEIGEPASTLGTDAGLVWDYALSASGITVTSKTFSVTGGTSTLGSGVMVFLDNKETITGSGSVTTSSSTLSGVGTIKAVGTGSVNTSSSTLSGTGVRGVSGTGSVDTSSSTLTGEGTVKKAGTGSIGTSSSTLTGTGKKTTFGTGSISTTAEVTGTGTRICLGTGSLAGVGTLDGTGTRVVLGTGSIEGSSILLGSAGDSPDPAEEKRLVRRTVLLFRQGGNEEIRKQY